MNYWDKDLEAYLTGVRERLRREHVESVATWRVRLHQVARKTSEALFMGGAFVYAVLLLAVPLAFSFGNGWILLLETLVWIPAYVVGLDWVMHVVAVGPPRSFRSSARMLWRNLRRWGTLDQWNH